MFHLLRFLNATKASCGIFRFALTPHLNFRNNYSAQKEINVFQNQNIREAITVWINVWIRKNGARVHDTPFIIFRWQLEWKWGERSEMKTEERGWKGPLLLFYLTVIVMRWLKHVSRVPNCSWVKMAKREQRQLKKGIA